MALSTKQNLKQIYEYVSSLNEDDSYLDKHLGTKKNMDKSFQSGKLHKVDNRIISSITEFATEGLELKNWYHDMHDDVMNALGESDGCLFLLLLASTSPQNMLTKNLMEASQCFVLFKKDLNANQERILEFLSSVSNSSPAIYESMVNDYSDLFISRLVDAGDELPMFETKIKNVVNAYRFYVDNNFSITKESSIDYITSKFDMKGQYAKDIMSVDNPIRGLKVASFAMNLIDPEFRHDDKWYSVTIDTWMIKFFFPFLNDYDIKGVNAFTAQYFKDPAKYMYLSSLVGKTADKMGMSPVKLQASIWVAQLKSAGKNVDSFKKVIDSKIKEMEMQNEYVDSIDNKLKQVIMFMSNINFKASAPKRIEPVDEPAPF